MRQTLKIQLERNGSVHGVHALLDDSALALPFDQFYARYVRPAFDQLIAEAKYRLDSPPSALGGPRDELGETILCQMNETDNPRF